jgi:beta-lactamase superfamily II metal-dependent hydrolase
MVDFDVSYPEKDEIEILIFGAGNSYGESILIHCKNDFWIMIDSHRKGKNNPIVLEYLKTITKCYSDKIKIIIATHWHDDHIKGLTDVAEASSNLEKICISASLTSDEFLTLTYLEELIKNNNSGIKEFKKLLTFLKEKRVLIPTLLSENQIVYQNNENAIELFSLSPSNYQILNSKIHIAQQLTAAKERRAISKENPNNNSIVLLLKIDDQVIILGADLEDGWENVINNYSISGLIANVFKIPHHGSQTSYNKAFWDIHLERKTIGLLSPWKIGSNCIPKDTDLIRIKSHIDSLFITSDPNAIKIKKRDKKIDKLINELDYFVRERTYELGVIRLRKKISENWKIDISGSAFQL